MRYKYVFDKRIDYNPSAKPQYRYKNVEIEFDIDFYLDYDFADEFEHILFSAVEYIAKLISDIFISETNFIQFPENFIDGFPEGFFESRYPESDKKTYVTIEYADYGTDFRKVNVVKSFLEQFTIPEKLFENMIRYYDEYSRGAVSEEAENYRREFVSYVRSKIADIVGRNLTGRPGRKRKGD